MHLLLRLYFKQNPRYGKKMGGADQRRYVWAVEACSLTWQIEGTVQFSLVC